MEIKQKLIPKAYTKTRPGIKIKPSYITVHETGNTSKGANALAHAKLQAAGNSRTASWHYQVDDKEIWQSIPDDEMAYHAGTSAGNSQSIAIEICVNQDGNFEKAKANAIWLIRHLMVKHNIPISRVVPHKHWSGKNCPQNLLPQWNQFIDQIKKAGEVKTVAPTQPQKATNMYDLSYLDGKDFKGLISSQYPHEIHDKVTWAMLARANCVLLLKRGFDIRHLQKALNEKYPQEG